MPQINDILPKYLENTKAQCFCETYLSTDTVDFLIILNLRTC